MTKGLIWNTVGIWGNLMNIPSLLPCSYIACPVADLATISVLRVLTCSESWKAALTALWEIRFPESVRAAVRCAPSIQGLEAIRTGACI